MGMEDWDFDDWQARFPLGEPSEPLRDDVLSADCCFVMLSQTSPLPRSHHWEDWYWSSDPRVILGFIRNVALPHQIGIWFFEHFEGERLTSQKYLKRARKVESFPKDIPLVQEVVDAVERIDVNSDRASIVAGLQEASALFNARFERTPTWDLSSHVYPDTRSAAEAFWDLHCEWRPLEHEGRELEREEWIDMCLAAQDDQVADAFVRATLTDIF